MLLEISRYVSGIPLFASACILRNRRPIQTNRASPYKLIKDLQAFSLKGWVMTILLTAVEARVLGALVEKEITTPEYYPLSLNALVNACNQKNNREPVLHLDEDEIRQALHRLEDNQLAGPRRGSDSRVAKYEHHLQEVFNFTRGEVAVL